MDFLVLGDLAILDGNINVTPTAPKIRQLLSLLVLRHNQSVPIDAVIDELWGARPPSRAVRTVRTYMYELRKCLPEQAVRILATGPNGYIARVPPEALDLHRFERLAINGREALVGGDPRRAKELLSGALSLWRGSMLADVNHGDLVEAHATRIEEMRLRAMELRVDACFQLNHHHELVAELKGLTATNRLHEGFHRKLMLALHRTGRRSEALEAFRELRRRLIEELGVEPGPELQSLHRSLLDDDGTPIPAPPEPRQQAATPAPAARMVTASIPTRPAQLPPDSVDFTGRHLALERLRHLLEAGRAGSGVPVISITGMAGVGKTTTAIHFAHGVSPLFPDGQLYIPLNGSRSHPVEPGEALGKELRAAGVAAADLPQSAEERTMMFRSWSFDQRLLVVVDDAASAAQIEPLIPGGDGCGVVVTGRSLHGIRGMQNVHLGAFDLDEAIEYLGVIIGGARIQAEPQAAAQLVGMVGGLPLALNFVGSRLNAISSMSLEEFNARLRAARDRHCGLSELSAVGLDLYDRLDTCYTRLSEDDRSAFLRIVLAPVTTFTTGQVGAMLSLSELAAGMLLMRLVDARLVEPHPDGTEARSTYRIHELVRVYAMERLTAATARKAGP